ncbi:MAG: hypothetical protein ACFE9M_11315 [Promethearchaeota archaeon]
MSEPKEFRNFSKIRNKLENFLKENQGSAFTINAISNRLEEIIKDTIQLEYAKENLQEILNGMVSNGKINITEHSGESHYLIEKAEKKPLKEQKVILEPLYRWVNDNRKNITEMLLVLGLLAGLGILLIGNISQFLISLIVILFAVSVIIEIVTLSKLSKENVKYRPPIYGIIALVFDIFGLIVLTILTPISLSSGFGFGSLESLYITPLAIVAILIGVGGLFFEKDNRPVAAMSGLFFGGILLIISVWPLFIFLASFIAVFYA